MRSTSDACIIYYKFIAGPSFLTEIRRCTDQSPFAHIIRATCLKFFGYIARANPSMDHSRALRASVTPLPKHWNCPSGQPCHTWLQTIESDLAPLSIGLATAYHRAQNREAWSMLVGTATSIADQATSKRAVKQLCVCER